MYICVYTHIFKIGILYQRKDKVQYCVIHEMITKYLLSDLFHQ